MINAKARQRLVAASSAMIGVAAAMTACRVNPPGPEETTRAAQPDTGAAVSSAARSSDRTARSQFGTPIAAGEIVPLTAIAKDTARYAKTTVKTEGNVTAVCQAMGCWMEIADQNGEAHIRMHGHSFFIPKTASGHRAIVEGTVLPRPDNGECEKEATEATGKTVKIELDATGVELL